MLSERLAVLLSAQDRSDIVGHVEWSECVLPLDVAAPLNLAFNEARLNCLTPQMPKAA